MPRKKPRKSYRPKPVLMPLGVKDFRKLEIPGRVGLLALGTGWLEIDHLIDIGCHVALVDRVARDVDDVEVEKLARVALHVCAVCQDRFERTGKVGVTGDELRQLREILPVTLAWIDRQQNHRIWAASQALLRQLDKKGGIPVEEVRDAS